MDNKELIRRALLGDKQAQEECTEKGIALPCPCCGRVEQAIINGSAVYHIHADCLMDARLVPLHKWNTRPAPPVGKCKECEYGRKFSQNDSQNDFHWEETEIFMICKEPYICRKREVKTLHTPDEYCNCFKPRED